MLNFKRRTLEIIKTQIAIPVIGKVNIYITCHGLVKVVHIVELVYDGVDTVLVFMLTPVAGREVNKHDS